MKGPPWTQKGKLLLAIGKRIVACAFLLSVCVVAVIVIPLDVVLGLLYICAALGAFAVAVMAGVWSVATILDWVMK